MLSPKPHLTRTALRVQLIAGLFVTAVGAYILAVNPGIEWFAVAQIFAGLLMTVPPAVEVHRRRNTDHDGRGVRSTS